MRGCEHADFSGKKVTYHQSIKDVQRNPKTQKFKNSRWWKGWPRKLSPLSVIALTMSEDIEPGKKELCQSFPSLEDAEACCIPDKIMTYLFG